MNLYFSKIQEGKIISKKITKSNKKIFYWLLVSHNTVLLRVDDLMLFVVYTFYKVTNIFKSVIYLNFLLYESNFLRYSLFYLRKLLNEIPRGFINVIVIIFQSDAWLDEIFSMKQYSPDSIPNPDCCGYLNRQIEIENKTFRTSDWLKRYCVLKDAVLFFYDNMEAYSAYGCVCLHGLKVLGNTTRITGRKHSFELMPYDIDQRTYIFAADTELEKKR